MKFRVRANAEKCNQLKESFGRLCQIIQQKVLKAYHLFNGSNKKNE